MNQKHNNMELTKWAKGYTQNGVGGEGILLKGDDARVLSVEKQGKIFRFMEECDGYFFEDFTKEEALEVVDELRKWIIKN